MTVDLFVKEMKQHWSWLYEQHLSKLYERQWAQWELLTIAGVLSLLLLLKIRRRRRKAAAVIAHAGSLVSDPPIIGAMLSGGRQNGNGYEDLTDGEESEYFQPRRRCRERVNATEESGWSDHTVRDLRREIIKRDQTQARLERQISELSAANDGLEREVVGLTAINERLMRQVSEVRRTEEPCSR